MEYTTHYNLKKPDGNDTFDEANDNANMDAIDAQMYANAQAAANGIPYAVDTSAAANTVTAAITPAPAAYVDGLAVCVKIANTSTGAATLNLNGLGAVPIHNGDGSAVGSGDLVAGVPVTLRYVGGASPAFIASGSGGLSGTGNATAADVLAPYTFTSASGKKQTGTMPDNGGVVITPGPNDIGIPAGHHDGTGKVSKVAFDASKLLTGTTVAGTAGTMTNNGGDIITPSNVDQPIPVGYHDGTGKVKAVAFDATKVLTGTTIASTPGTMPNQGAPTLNPGQTLTAGYYSGGSVASPTAGSQTFSTPGSFSFTVPSGVTRLLVELWGGGAGGGSAAYSGSSFYNGAGGGGGAYTLGYVNVTPGQVITGTVGAGGFGGASNGQTGNPGNNGANTTFGNLTANGGVGGRTVNANASTYTSAGGTANGTNAAVSLPGGAGTSGIGGNSTTTVNQPGGGAASSGGAGNAPNGNNAGLGATALSGSILTQNGGNGGGGGTSGGAGQPGIQPGGGGGGAGYNGYTSGGKGGDGMVIVHW